MDNLAQNNQQPGRKHSRNADKIQKGYTAAYPTQSSIPFKYQSSIIPESEKKGFNSQAKRFYHKKGDIRASCPARIPRENLTAGHEESLAELGVWAGDSGC
ncbi:hypothetical protein PAL_GLEAN10015145 [Pteropus alecto]|uniref:Uncharacterized protein n=1 Tax=Pteropus alecto TaxID=9402 RepID=L5JV01_PTEAL|nr:hypothetical protein PAL_GLEAN10015145 [Pteropus alecto]